jgi:hypothetical protein
VRWAIGDRVVSARSTFIIGTNACRDVCPVVHLFQYYRRVVRSVYQPILILLILATLAYDLAIFLPVAQCKTVKRVNRLVDDSRQ